MATASSNPFAIEVIDPPSGVPSWYSSAPSGTWVEVPGSTFSASPVFTAAAAAGLISYGYGNARYVVEAWNSGVLNTVGVYHNGVFVPGIFLIIFGGGHGDYAGNEVYAFGPLNSASPSWRMLTNPTIPPPINVGRDANGMPVSRHTYDTLGYLAQSNRMISVAAPPMYQLGGSDNTADTFSFGVNPQSTNPWTPIGRITMSGAYGTQMVCCAVDELAGKVYAMVRQSHLNIYDIASNTWTTRTGVFGWDWWTCTCDIDPNTKVIVQVDGQSTNGGPRTFGIDVRNPSVSVPTFQITAAGMPSGLATSVVWDQRTGKFVVWMDNRTLYYLTPPANPYQGSGWTWSTVTPSAGASPGAGHTQGTFKRFGPMPATMPGYYLMPRYDQPVYIYKP